MPQAQGSNVRIGLLKEATWGVTPAVSAGDVHVIPILSESLNASQERLQNAHLATSRAYGPGVLGRVEGAGDLTVNLGPNAHGWLLRGLLGPPTTTGAGPYTHVFKVPASLPSYTVEKWFADITKGFRFTGMVVGSMGFKFGPAGFVETTVSFVGKNAASATAALDSAPTTYTDAPFDLAATATALSEGGSTLGTATALELSIDNELDGDLYTLANAGARGAIAAGKLKVTGKLSAFFDSLTLYDKAANSTESSLSYTLQHGTGAGTAGNEQLVIAVNELLYGRAVPQVGRSGGVLVELPFDAYYANHADASPVTVTLKNAIASYA